jgi:hypothetical protein
MECQGRTTEHTAAVPADGDFTVRMVLRSGTRDGRESAIDAVNRRAIHTDAVLWDSEDDPVARRAKSSCSFSPPALMLGDSPQTATLVINTTALTASISGSSNDRNRRAAAWLLFPLGGIVGLGATRRKSRRHRFVPALVLSTCALLIFLEVAQRSGRAEEQEHQGEQKPFEQLSGAA